MQFSPSIQRPYKYKHDLHDVEKNKMYSYMNTNLHAKTFKKLCWNETLFFGALTCYFIPENVHYTFRIPLAVHPKILSRLRVCDYRRGLNWWLDLLTTYTHDSKLQAITVSPLIATIHKSTQHPQSIFHPTVSSAVPWQRLLTVEILQLHALRF
jgi:hypothetical protein